MCPIFRATGAEAATPRAKANLLRMLATPNEVTPEQVKSVANLCVNCKMCRDDCDARVNIPKLMLEAKAANVAQHGMDRMEWALARTVGLERRPDTSVRGFGPGPAWLAEYRRR